MKIQDLHRSLELYPIDVLSACDSSTSPLEKGIKEGENPVSDLSNQPFTAYDACSMSRVVWDCSSKWVVSFI
jgi:hypothetical protein